MNQFLFDYQPVAPTTWVYLSSLVTIGLFFKFGRFWSMRNLDMGLLILLAPGLLLIYFGYHTQPRSEDVNPSADQSVQLPGRADDAEVDPAANATDAAPPPSQLSPAARLKRSGYRWLLACCLLWFIRLVIDPALVRRPLLLPNLSVGGLAFMGVALFIFLMANVVTSPDGPVQENESGRVRMDRLIEMKSGRGPGYAVLDELPTKAHRTIVITAHFAIVLGLVLVGYRHFDNTANGFGAAMLYLLVPYTSQMTGRLDHFLPAALLVWAITAYRNPTIAGVLVGAASGLIYYPLFLLPAWISFYARRGWLRFTIGALATLLLMALALMLIPGDEGFWSQLRRMFGVIRPARTGLEGFWAEDIGGWDSYYRLPVLVAVMAFCLSMGLWPVQKNLGTLISCSAVVMVASQFYLGWQGGLYIAWYLPLALLTIFRPNLDDRVAQSVVINGWLSRKTRLTPAT